ncbi:MAG: BREX-1 system adenine-specific DNA-methyltransferase PglX [Eubacteriales bacterium]|nr:BREX-1 system adenine-specific DNA-methyltransferase PglX [Eubacteriales bacterium]
MNKSELKNFAIRARLSLRERVQARAALYGVTPAACANKTIASSADFRRLDGGVLTGREIRQRAALIARVTQIGYESAMEEAAYTWFNRIVAIKYLQEHNLLPLPLRALPDAPGETPQLLRQAQDVTLPGVDPDTVLQLLDQNRADELYKYLLIALCNALAEPLPGMFETIREECELLFPDFLLKEDSVLGELARLEPDSWQEIQVIGWLYQYYITEINAQLYDGDMSKSRIPKELLPAATQIFTPEWVVKYMVENSLGRLWLEGHPDENLRMKWRYFMDEAQQTPEVTEKLRAIRAPYAGLQPEQLTVLDPCMGSGHILVYAFDVLMDIYRSVGYTDRDAARSILEHNLCGLDIDDRAAQLAYFAVMMNPCEYDRRFLRRGVQPHVCAVQESAPLDAAALSALGPERPLAEKLLQTFADGKEYGSLLQPELTEEELTALENRLNALETGAQETLLTLAGSAQAAEALRPLLRQARLLTRKYHAVITNPPYMGGSGMNDKLSRFVKEHYPDSKSDMFAVFIERCGELTGEGGYQAMITQHAWMFLSSYEKLRQKLQSRELVSMAHLGPRAFEEIGGEVVQTTAFVLSNAHIPGYRGTYARLIEPTTQAGKEDMFLSETNRYTAQQDNFSKIPGAPVAYWVSERLIDNFEKGISIDDISDFTGGQHKTADNEKYLRLFWEIDSSHIGNGKSWAFYAKGGEYRKWYGNIIQCVCTTDKAMEFYKNNASSNCLDSKYWFTEGITYSAVTSKGTGFRYYPPVGGFDIGGATICYVQHFLYILALLNSNISEMFFQFLNPTINLQIKDVKAIPVIWDERENTISLISKKQIKISKSDWDSFETSWDFKKHPMI